MNLYFEGGARMVTGSCSLLTACGKKVLIDCGMRQGADAKSDDGVFSFAVNEIDALLLTHAHIDHTGLVPLLFNRGFKGSIYATKVTRDLCTIMLADSGHIQEMEAQWKTVKARRAGRDAIQPLYTAEQGLVTAQQITPKEYDEIFEVFPGIAACFVDAGHLLGSAMIKFWIEEDGVQKQIVFSGDIGNHDRPIVRDPSEIASADYVIMESTYGDRLHPPRGDDKMMLAGIIKQTFDGGGNVIMPAFSVGRTQELLYDLSTIMRERMAGLERFDVYVDSPLSSKATRVFAENFNQDYFDKEAMERKRKGDDPFNFDTLHFVQSADESKALNLMPNSKVIISSSGMCEAGRIKHHLKHNLYRSECAIVFAGYQAVGTLGRRIVDGEKRVRIFGEEIGVNASIHRLQGFSGHADQNGLLEWIGAFDNKPTVFVNHGEEEVAIGYAKLLQQRGYNAKAPGEGDVLDLATGVLQAAPESASVRKITETVHHPELITQVDINWGDMRKRIRKDGKRLMETAELLDQSLREGLSGKKGKKYGELLKSLRDTAREMIRG